MSGGTQRAFRLRRSAAGLTMTTLDTKADCYSAGERGAMGWWQDLRARWLGPLLAAMAAVGIRPDHVTAASLALKGDGKHFVPLDACIETMRQTGVDMNEKYKETSTGGLAVNVVEC